MGAQWLSGRVLDWRPKGHGFEPHGRLCVVSLSKNINPNLVLVQPRKNHPFITERLLMGLKKSNQTKTNKGTALYQSYQRGDHQSHSLKIFHLYRTFIQGCARYNLLWYALSAYVIMVFIIGMTKLCFYTYSHVARVRLTETGFVCSMTRHSLIMCQRVY